MSGQYFKVPLISQIEGNLWSGGSPEYLDVPDYFKAILNLYPWGAPYTYNKNDVQYREVELYDSPSVANKAVLEELADWVNARRTEGPVLVHCQAGLNRSGLITALALIRSGSTPDEAIKQMREKRSDAVLCNANFEKWLREYEFGGAS